MLQLSRQGRVLGVGILMSAESARQGHVDRPERRRIGQFKLAGTDNVVELFEHLGLKATQYLPD